MAGMLAFALTLALNIGSLTAKVYELPRKAPMQSCKETVNRSQVWAVLIKVSCAVISAKNFVNFTTVRIGPYLMFLI